MTENPRSTEAWLAAAPGASECLRVGLGCDLTLLARVASESFAPLWSSDAARLEALPAEQLTPLMVQVTDGHAPVCMPDWASQGSVLAVPLLGFPDDPGIVLAVFWETRRALVDQDVRFAVNIAALLSEAGQGAWLRDKLFQPVQGDDARKSRRSRERATFLETLNFISESAREGKLFNEIAADTLRRLTSGLDTEFGALYFGLDGAWILVAHAGFDDRFPMAAGFLPAGLLPWTQLAEPASDFDVGEPLSGLFTEAGIASWAVLPMFDEGQVKGGMLLASREAARFSAELVDMLARISRQLQVSMLQARLSRDLAEQTADLQAVIRSLSDALIEVTADRCVMQANAAAIELLGVSGNGRRADDWHALVPLFDLHRDQPAGEAHPIVQTFMHAVPQRTTQWRLVAGGRTVYVSVTAAPIMDESQSRVRAAVLVLRDITEQRAAEQKLLSAEKHASVASLAAGVAHEFKNYLGGMLGNASLALQAAASPDVAGVALQRILDIGARANQTALSLLSFVGDSKDSLQTLDLGHLLQEVTCLFEQRAQKQHVTMTPDVALDVCMEGVASKVRQVMLNVLENALDAMPEGGRLEVALSGDRDHATLTIRDTGVGIAPEHLGRVFDPFFSTKGVWGGEAGVGNGLGLTTTANYVREMSGRIDLESTPGQGTLVRIVFPRVHRQLVAVDSAAGLSRSAILLECDPAARELLCRLLAEDSWQVTVAADALDLQAQLDSGRPALAFLDATMPGKLNFIRAFDALKEKAPGCRVVVTTGTATDYQLAEYIQAASARLIKPLSASLIQAFLRGQHQALLPA